MTETGSLLAHLGIPKYKSGLKIFFVLYNEKMYPVHKQSEGGPEIAGYYFFIPEAGVIIAFFGSTIFKYFH